MKKWVTEIKAITKYMRNNESIPTEIRSELSELLAIIHGDGGHHETEVGTLQAIKDARSLFNKKPIKAKDIMHLYFGQKCIAKPNHIENHNGMLCKIIEFPLTGTEYNCISGDGLKFWSFGYDIKLILRPLSSMTEEEMKEFGVLEMNYEICKTEAGWKGFMGKSQDFAWLLSKGFDIFNLRENNECLYESDLTRIANGAGAF